MAVDKAVDSKALDTLFGNIGNAIREKDGTTALITPGNMPAKIRAIRTGETVKAQSKTATPSFAEQVISPDTSGGYNYLSQVTVKPIPVSYVDNEQGGQTVIVG